MGVDLLLGRLADRLVVVSFSQIYRFKDGEFQPDCSADQPVAGPCQPTANPNFVSSDTKKRS
eukprot:1146840-Pelagomonas_calceolata.AAC.1